MNKTLVTGATGFIGSRLVRRLLAEGRDVTIFRRPSSSLKNLADFRVDDIVGDLNSASDWSNALDGCQSVFHLAACAGMMDRLGKERETTNVEAVRVMCKALRHNRNNIRLIHCSSVAAVGLSKKPVEMNEETPFNLQDIHYARTKKAGEDLVIEGARGGLNAVIVNPATVVGEGMSWMQTRAFVSVATGKSLFYPPGGTCVSYVEDVVNGMILAEQRGGIGERYILGGTNVSFRDYFARIAAVSGVRPPGIRLPGWLLPHAGRIMELISGKVGRDAGRIAAGFGWFSSGKAVRELGYKITALDDVIGLVYEKLMRSRTVKG